MKVKTEKMMNHKRKAVIRKRSKMTQTTKQIRIRTMLGDFNLLL